MGFERMDTQARLAYYVDRIKNEFQHWTCHDLKAVLWGLDAGFKLLEFYQKTRLNLPQSGHNTFVSELMPIMEEVNECNKF